MMAYTNVTYSATLHEAGDTTDSSGDEVLIVSGSDTEEDGSVNITEHSSNGVKLCARWSRRLLPIIITSFALVLIICLVALIQRKIRKSSEMYLEYKSCMETNVLEGIPSTTQLEEWVKRLPKCLPKFASTFSFGKTFENRSLNGVRLGRQENKELKFENNMPSSKKNIWLQGGIHSKEWITVTSILYVMEQIIILYLSDNSTLHNMVLNYEWYFVPLVNPDGYNYSRTKSKEWRKNRRPTFQSDNKTCFGVDLNRNWEFQWKYDLGIQENNTDPCSDNYAGISAFSEPETKGLSEVISNVYNHSHLTMFISLHSLGQKWLLPWSYTQDGKSLQYNTTYNLAAEGAIAIEKRHQTKWRVGQASLIVYTCSGTALDWVAALGTPFVYTLELRPADHSTYGHYPPMKEVVKSGEEFWSGLRAMVDRLTKRGS